jgi:phosphatidylserine/phosphatidylglycerophosphate/cardiolipin synthase-like enzyme
MLRRLFGTTRSVHGVAPSKLFNERTFYAGFLVDLHRARNEVIIESPFITSRRMSILLPELRKLIKRGVKLTINTRDLLEHDEYLEVEARNSIATLQAMGVIVLYTGGHHRKLAIIDRQILWEGSLNILSQNDSCEIMRRIESEEAAAQMIQFVKLNKFIDRY